jgi:hypothetical protein
MYQKCASSENSHIKENEKLQSIGDKDLRPYLSLQDNPVGTAILINIWYLIAITTLSIHTTFHTPTQNKR